MTVYVDDMRLPAKVGRYQANWSHLFSDSTTYDELHAFAACIGLRRSWFQHKPSGPGRAFDMSHYDVTDRVRQAAIKAGATPVPCGDTASILRAAHDRRTSP